MFACRLVRGAFAIFVIESKASRTLGGVCVGGWVGGGWIRLLVGFQPLMVISPTARWIRWCMQVYACELMWTCLVGTEQSTPENFGVPSHRFNSATGEQKGITQTIYTDFKVPSRWPNLLMPNDHVPGSLARCLNYTLYFMKLALIIACVAITDITS